MFSRNGTNGPESKTTRMFRPVGQVAAPGAKSAVSDCVLFLWCNAYNVHIAATYPSVCLSVTLVYCVETVETIINQSTLDCRRALLTFYRKHETETIGVPPYHV